MHVVPPELELLALPELELALLALPELPLDAPDVPEVPDEPDVPLAALPPSGAGCAGDAVCEGPAVSAGEGSVGACVVVSPAVGSVVVPTAHASKTRVEAAKPSVTRRMRAQN